MAELRNINIANSDLVQSPYLSFDAAGSDGADGSTKGVHLRWGLEGTIGDVHIPKGDLANNTGSYPAVGVGYSKNNDFVQVYRTELKKRFPTKVHLINDQPQSVTKVGNTIVWRYEVTLSTIAHVAVKRTVELRFMNLSAYALAVTGKNLTIASDKLAFLQAYTGVIEMELLGQLAFTAQVSVVLKDAVLPTDTQIRLESVSVVENLKQGPLDRYTSYRNAVKFDSSLAEEVVNIPVIENNVILQPKNIDKFLWMAANIKYLRFDYVGVFPLELSLESYADFIMGTSAQTKAWESVGETSGFGLKYNILSDEEVFARLDRPEWGIDGSWPKYSPGTQGIEVDDYKVVTDNYQKHWGAEMGLKYAVKNYLELSQIPSNLKAILKAAQEGMFDIAVVDALRIAATDFHVARMLGLGHIDVDGFAEENSGQRYVYMVKYTTAFTPEQQLQTDHYAMSLPVGAIDNMLPEVPELTGFTFGFQQVDGADETTPLVELDENGYTKNGKSRFININIEDPGDLTVYKEFFESDAFLEFKAISPAVAYGIEYKGKKGSVWETNYRNPKIHCDSSNFDANDNKEVIPLYSEENLPIYRHLETENGWHRYAAYAINIFSRASGLSTAQDIESAFTKGITILPPINMFSRLIQDEVPRILNTDKDQELLSGLSADKTLVKARFQIDHTHYANHDAIDKVELYYRDRMPERISGKVKSVSIDPTDSSVAIIETENVVLSPTETLDPSVAGQTDEQLNHKYLGSAFATNEGRFIVKSVTQGINNKARVRVFKGMIGNASKDADGYVSVSKEVVLPRVGEYFTMVENLLVMENWTNSRIGTAPNKLSKEVAIQNFSPVTVWINGNAFKGIRSIQQVINETDVYLEGSVDAVGIGQDFKYASFYAAKTVINERKIAFEEDYSDVFKAGTTFKVVQAQKSEDLHEFTVESYEEGNVLTVTSDILSLIPHPFLLAVEKTAKVTAKDTTQKIVRVDVDLTKQESTRNEFYLTHVEVVFREDGVPVIQATGGLVGNVEFTPLIEQIIDPDDSTKIKSAHLGRYAVEFKSYKYQDAGFVFQDPENPEFMGITFDGGILRVREIEANEPKDLIVDIIHRLGNSEKGLIDSYLKLIVTDPTYMEGGKVMNVDPNVIQTASAEAIFFPAYQLYLVAENNKMQDDDLLPQGDALDKVTLLGTRVVDSITYAAFGHSNRVRTGASSMSTASMIKAIKIIGPVKPTEPEGPSFATRPDVYFRSSYSFEVSYPSSPYAIMFFRANTAGILGILYEHTLAESLRDQLDAIADRTYHVAIWQTLLGIFEVVGNTPDVFVLHAPSGFRFPIPNNPNYIAPSADPDPEHKRVPFKPFKQGVTSLQAQLTDPNDANITHLMFNLVKQAIVNAFTGLQEKPILYDEIKEGKQTSAAKPVINDENDRPLLKSDSRYNPAPMVVKLPGQTAVRFTDYTLDGASNDQYFYFSMTMGNQMTFSDLRDVIVSKPVFMVNTTPASSPIIRKVVARLANPILGVTTAVLFELDDFPANEGIKYIDVYRTTDPDRVTSVRTMQKAKRITLVQTDQVHQIADDFEGEAFIPYGDPLYYRLVAGRSIINELGEEEIIPSEPSQLVLASIVDVFNPEAPQLQMEGDFNNASLKWSKTTYNGIYRLFKMTATGNWTFVKEYADSQDEFSHSLGVLAKYDEDGSTIYYRYKVDVENSSGLLNLSSKELTI